MRTLTEIKSLILYNKPYLYSKYPIESLAIFGSYARNEQNTTSDIDVLVEFNGKIGIKFIDLADEMERLLETKVDFVSRKAVNERYFNAIKNDLIYV